MDLCIKSLIIGSWYEFSDPDILSKYFFAYEAIDILFLGLISVIEYNFSNSVLIIYANEDISNFKYGPQMCSFYSHVSSV